MNILYINHYAGSPQYGMEYRPYYLAKEWVRSGHNVTILAATFSHLRFNNPLKKDRGGKKITVEQIDGIKYVWYSTPSYFKNGIHRVRNIITFLLRVWFDSKNVVCQSNPDVVIASSTYPMDIWVAKRLARMAKAKLVFEVHDLWPLSPIELGGMSPNHPFIRWCQYAENTAYRDADVVVSVLPCISDHAEKHGLQLSKLHFIPNGVVEEDWLPNNIHPLSDDNLFNFLNRQKEAGKIIVGYAGYHGIPNALEYFLDAAKQLKKYENIVFVSIGSGLEKDNLIKKKHNDGIDNFYFFDSIPKMQIPSFLEEIDIAYIGAHEKSMSLYRFGVSPNKVMDYMMAAKPIICAIQAGNDIVKEANCGITVSSSNPNAIADGILVLSHLSNVERSQLGKNGKEFILKNHTYSVLAEKFIKAMR